MFDTIKDLFDIGLYTEQDLDLFVSVQWITEEQKEEILGKQKQETETTASN